VARLRFIRRAKELGFSLGEIADLLALRVDADTPCAEVRARAQLKLDDIASRMRSLRRMQRALSRLVRKCDERTPTGECPILEALDRRD
jgi:DNA-binding transcriptional MerR regulator